MKTFGFLTTAALLFLVAQRQCLAGSATWNSNPTTGDWNTAGNWMPNTVPNGTSDIATFGASNVTDVINTDVIVNLDSLILSPGAPSYTITALDNIALYGTGIVNNSGTTQSFVAGGFFFNNGATAGNMTSFSNVGGYIDFEDFSSAGSATIDLSDNMYQAGLDFYDSSTAANATINVSGGAFVSLFGNATGGMPPLPSAASLFLGFVDNVAADHASATCIGGDRFTEPAFSSMDLPAPAKAASPPSEPAAVVKKARIWTSAAAPRRLTQPWSLAVAWALAWPPRP